MKKIYLLAVLFLLYLAYSLLVYSKGTETEAAPASPLAAAGKDLFQKHNCGSCHQVYGLGGYLGTDLTTAYSDPKRGPAYMKALLQAGGGRMPDFRLKEEEINALMAYFQYIDTTASTYKNSTGHAAAFFSY